HRRDRPGLVLYGSVQAGTGCGDYTVVRRNPPAAPVSRAIGAILEPREQLVQLLSDGKPRFSGTFLRVSDGTRTRDRLDHNQELYQLSYAHQVRPNLAVVVGLAELIEQCTHDVRVELRPGAAPQLGEG